MTLPFACLLACLLAVCLSICGDDVHDENRAAPRTSAAFTGYVGNAARDGAGNPSGTVLLCVANTPIPCTMTGMASQKSIQFTVLNIRKKGWIYAPWFAFLRAVVSLVSFWMGADA